MTNIEVKMSDKANDNQPTWDEVFIISKISFIQMYSYNEQETKGKFKFYIKQSDLFPLCF